MSTTLTEVIKYLLDSMDERRKFQALDEHTQKMLDRAIDRVIDGTDSRIRAVPGYKKKIYKSILKSLEYTDSLIELVPHAIELNSSHFSSNPYIRAFFPTMNGLKKVFRQSSELQDYFTDTEHVNDSESCVLLCMRKEEETVLGMELDGDQVIRDVKQTRVNFAGHRIYSPAESETFARRELKCCIFEGLVDNALAKISELRERRNQLESKQQILSSRLRGRKRGMTINDGVQGMQADSVSLRKETLQLKQIEQELSEIGYVTPEFCLDTVNDILSHPEVFVNIQNISMKLDKAGIKRGKDDPSHSVNVLNLSEVRIKGHRPRVVTLAKIHRDELDSSSKLLL